MQFSSGVLEMWLWRITLRIIVEHKTKNNTKLRESSNETLILLKIWKKQTGASMMAQLANTLCVNTGIPYWHPFLFSLFTDNPAPRLWLGKQWGMTQSLNSLHQWWTTERSSWFLCLNQLSTRHCDDFGHEQVHGNLSFCLSFFAWICHS